jgi:hypothetical protein
MDEFLTARQAAVRLQISYQKVHVLIAEGRFPGTYKLDPQKQTSPYRIPIQDIEAFEQARQASTDSK